MRGALEGVGEKPLERSHPGRRVGFRVEENRQVVNGHDPGLGSCRKEVVRSMDDICAKSLFDAPSLQDIARPAWTTRMFVVS
jgi:hypothetical protein